MSPYESHLKIAKDKIEEGINELLRKRTQRASGQLMNEFSDSANISYVQYIQSNEEYLKMLSQMT